MLLYDLHPDIKAFTTTTSEGRNADLICPQLGVPVERFVRPHQVHDTKVFRIDDAFMTLGEAKQKELLDGIDAVIYDVRNACIGISTADCIPVIAYDPEHHCAAAIHAGWRGTVACIVKEAVLAMKKAYSTDPKSLFCAIGPGISLSSFEVGDEVYEAFADAGFNMSLIARRYPSGSKGSNCSKGSSGSNGSQAERWHLDLKECNRQQLLELGVSEENIIVSDIDTMTSPDYFSARRDGAKTGRMLTGIVILP